MGDRGYLSGAACHIEYHSVNRKKEKAADCVYLDTNRICRCRRSPWYLAKCFDATCCSFREREQKVNPKPTPPQKPTAPTGTDNSKILKALSSARKKKRCAPFNIPIGTVLFHKVYGKGRLCAYNREGAVMTVQFSTNTARFIYPDAFDQGFLSRDAMHQRR